MQQQNDESSDTDCKCKSALTARIISGSIGSIVTSLIVTPLEVVKVRMQAAAANGDMTAIARPSNVVQCPRGCGTFVLYNGQMDCVLPKSAVPFFDKATGKCTAPAGHILISSSSSTVAGHAADHNVGTIAMVRRIFAREGFAGIYAGLRPTLVMAAPNTVLYFSAYEEIVWRLRNNSYYGTTGTGTTEILSNNNNSGSSSSSGSWLFPLVAGGSARLVSSTVTAPLEFLRTRQAAATGQNLQVTTGLWQDFRTIIRTEGFATLYRGLRPTLWRDVPFSAIYWLSLEQFRLYWKQVSPVPPSPLEQAGQAFVNGAVAGMIAAACTTPFDVIKTRQQAGAAAGAVETAADEMSGSLCKHDGAVAYEGSSVLKSSSKPPAVGTFQLLRQLAQTEGLAGLWRGNQARMLKVAPGCAIMISSYEFGKRILE